MSGYLIYGGGAGGNGGFVVSSVSGAGSVGTSYPFAVGHGNGGGGGAAGSATWMLPRTSGLMEHYDHDLCPVSHCDESKSPGSCVYHNSCPTTSFGIIVATQRGSEKWGGGPVLVLWTCIPNYVKVGYVVACGGGGGGGGVANVPNSLSSQYVKIP